MIRIQAESEHLYRMACEYYHREEYDRALEDLDEAVRISPEFSSALCLMGHCREKQGEDEIALELYSHAIDVDPYHAKAWYYKGDMLKRLGRAEDGEKHIQKAMALSFGR